MLLAVITVMSMTGMEPISAKTKKNSDTHSTWGYVSYNYDWKIDYSEWLSTLDQYEITVPNTWTETASGSFEFEAIDAVKNKNKVWVSIMVYDTKDQNYKKLANLIVKGNEKKLKKYLKNEINYRLGNKGKYKLAMDKDTGRYYLEGWIGQKSEYKEVRKIWGEKRPQYSLYVLLDDGLIVKADMGNLKPSYVDSFINTLTTTVKTIKRSDVKRTE